MKIAKYPPALNGFKQCHRCDNEYPVSEFYKSSTARDGLYPSCKTCKNIRNRSLRYGLTEQEVLDILGNPCEICGGEGVQIDHCHATSVVRGLLCSTCNLMLGLMNDSVDDLRRAAAYLERGRI